MAQCEKRKVLWRIAVRRDKKRVILAVAHSMAIAIMLKSKTAYRELGANFFDAQTIHSGPSIVSQNALRASAIASV